MGWSLCLFDSLEPHCQQASHIFSIVKEAMRSPACVWPTQQLLAAHVRATRRSFPLAQCCGRGIPTRSTMKKLARSGSFCGLRSGIRMFSMPGAMTHASWHHRVPCGRRHAEPQLDPEDPWVTDDEYDPQDDFECFG